MTVRTATNADLALVGAIAGEGFFDDPVMTWVMPDATMRASALIAFTGLAGTFLGPTSALHVLDDACVTMWRAPTWIAPEPTGERRPSPFAPDVAERFRIL